MEKMVSDQVFLARADSPRARAQWVRLFSALLIAAGVAGCGRASSSQPLTTADLERMAIGRVLLASLERVDGHSMVFLENDPSKPWSRILRSMAPVISARAAGAGDFDPEYVYIFQSGKNPIEFQIRVRGDALCYRVENIDYEGGNAKDFLEAVKGLFP